MPIAIIVAVIVAALGAGFFFYSSSTPDAMPEATTEVVARPIDETEDTTLEPINSDDQVDENDNANNDREPEIIADTAATADTNTGSNSTYTNGTYTASATYLTPRRTEHLVGVTLTIENDVVVNSVVTFDGVEKSYSNDNQARFDQVYTAEVIGKPLDTVSLSRVGSASLTSNAFNEAKAKIVTEARS